MPPEEAPAGTAVPVPLGVPAVVVVDESGVEGGGVSVGRDKPGLVGGRVEVTKTDLVAAGVSSEIVMHEPRLRLVSRSNIQIFFIRGFYLGNIKAGAKESRRLPRTKQLLLCKDQGVKAVIVKEGVAHANLGESGAYQVLPVTRVGLVVNPPVDRGLPIQRWVVAVDVF